MLSAALAVGLKAFVIGFSGAMAPGPLLTVTITETIRRGRLSAILLIVGHALLEIVFIAAFIFGLRYVLGDPVVVNGVSLGGGLFLVWMGGTLVRDVLSGGAALDLEYHGERPKYGPLMDGVATSLSNPYWTIWWATIGATLVLEALRVGPLALGSFYLGHVGADFVWYALVIWAVSSGRRLITPRVYGWLLGILGVIVLLLGAAYVSSAARALLS